MPLTLRLALHSQPSLRREDELSKWYKQLVLRSANQLGYEISRDPLTLRLKVVKLAHQLGHDYLNDIAYLRDVRLAFDIGAHVGETAERFLKAFPNAHVVCFEPDPKSFERLKVNTERFSRVTCEPCGLGDVESVLTFNQNGFDQTSSFLTLPASWAGT